MKNIKITFGVMHQLFDLLLQKRKEQDNNNLVLGVKLHRMHGKPLMIILTSTDVLRQFYAGKAEVIEMLDGVDKEGLTDTTYPWKQDHYYQTYEYLQDNGVVDLYKILATEHGGSFAHMKEISAGELVMLEHNDSAMFVDISKHLDAVIALPTK